MNENIQNKDKNKPIVITIKLSHKAKDKIENLAKKNFRSMTKEIERLIMEAE